MAEKKQEFVVSDRRRFAPEGELRTDAPVQEAEEEKPAAPAAPSTADSPSSANAGPQPADSPAASPEASAPPAGTEIAEEPSEEIPAPPTAQEQQAQTDAYKASGKKLDDLFSQTTAGQRRAPTEMTFERLIESFYMTALFQLGALRQEGEAPGVDIIGARQTIDSITLIQERPKAI